MPNGWTTTVILADSCGKDVDINQKSRNEPFRLVWHAMILLYPMDVYVYYRYMMDIIINTKRNNAVVSSRANETKNLEIGTLCRIV